MLCQEPMSGVILIWRSRQIDSEGCIKYPDTKTMNLISRQGYAMNWFLFLCHTISVLMLLMFNDQLLGFN